MTPGPTSPARARSSRAESDRPIGTIGDPAFRDESALIDAVLAGNVAACRTLIRTYRARIYGLALRRLRDGRGVEAATRETFVRALRELSRFRRDSRLEEWIEGIAIEQCGRLSAGGRGAAFLRRILRWGSASIAASRSGRARGSREVKRRLRKAIDPLPPFQRVVFALRHFEEKSLAGIAADTGVDRKAVEAALFHAAEAIRSRIAEEEARSRPGLPGATHLADPDFFFLTFPPAGAPAGVPAHLSTCDRCSRRLADWETAARGIVGRPGTALPDFERQVMERFRLRAVPGD